MSDYTDIVQSLAILGNSIAIILLARVFGRRR